ncbi:MAG TPA: flagellar motor switch protein FliM [Deltaproteobacteria bacterium]|nr:MAG: flagellar motor switch protein FliM [Deltaproteobacteria bacterium GWA2_55_82]OIJ72836.1 MAG: flagellar motor switch protein FliM [Deltaproteobacteria bacterium GWC2_55_46]HBG46115.1 flagellar motor switch protein FliM [Deltaproteobacteria bacterium]HCY11613.1 flagellar motor switch protein FliM [Deltaproteobacteria bacterium]
MAEQILTQVEVDALLRGLSNGDIKTEAERQEEGETGDVRSYDFANQEKVIRGKLPALEMINEKFSRAARIPLFNVMRKTVDISPDSTKTLKYEEFLRNLQVPSSLNVFQLMPFRGQGVLSIDPSLVFLIVDSYFGGDGRFHNRIEGRDFTNVEQAVVKKIVEVIFHEMCAVWKAVHPVEFKPLRSEMNPQFVNIVAPSEHVMVSTFRMEIEAISGNFFICIPYSTLEPIKDKLLGSHRIDSSEVDVKWTENLKSQFAGVTLALSGEIGRAEISITDLLSLKAGDVIQLDRKVKDLLDVHVEDLPKFLARPGVMDNNYALKMMESSNGERS